MAGRAPDDPRCRVARGVSVATASNVVNGNRPVGEPSRPASSRRSRRSATGSNRSASALRGKSTRLVGMVVPDITNAFFASLVHGIEALAERDGYDLLIVSSSEDARRSAAASRRCVARRIDGLIVVPASDDSMAALGGETARRPAAAGGAGRSRLRSPGVDTVGAECDAGGSPPPAISIGLGHRDIAV